MFWPLSKTVRRAEALDKIMTVDETWVFQYDSETKCQCPVKISPILYDQWSVKVRTFLICFVLYYPPWISSPLKQLTRHFCFQILLYLLQYINWESSNLWLGTILCYNNAPPYIALTVKWFLAKKGSCPCVTVSWSWTEISPS